MSTLLHTWSIMCILSTCKGIHSRVSIDTLNWHPIDTRLALDQHLHWHLIDTPSTSPVNREITNFLQTCQRVLIDESVDGWPTINWLPLDLVSIRCQSRCWQPWTKGTQLWFRTEHQPSGHHITCGRDIFINCLKETYFLERWVISIILP